MGLPLPPNSQTAFKEFQKNQRPHNPGLLFDRYLSVDNDSRDELTDICDSAEQIDERLLKAFVRRWEESVKRLNGFRFPLITDWRFFTGAGQSAAFEVGFKFNRYGFPFLPGSGVKGVARAWAFLELAEELGLTLEAWDKLISHFEEDSGEKPYREWFMEKYPQASEKAVQHAENIRTIFGTPDSAGGAIFLDAVPDQKPKLEMDILNPHYSKYYGGNNLPTDDQNPIPNLFLTVASNTKFQFAVGWRGSKELSDKQKDLRGIAKGWLENGLKELGAGAKTSAGYGYFKDAEKADFEKAVSKEMVSEETTSSKLVDDFMTFLNKVQPKGKDEN